MSTIGSASSNSLQDEACADISLGVCAFHPLRTPMLQNLLRASASWPAWVQVQHRSADTDCVT
jgi:hypothetical protein